MLEIVKNYVFTNYKYENKNNNNEYFSKTSTPDYS